MKHYCSICLLAKNEHDYIEEWLDWHGGIGVDHFYIYDNNSTIPLSESIPERYRDKCTIVDFSGQHFHTQLSCYKDCLKRFGAETQWLAFIDADEFIRVVDSTPLPKFLQEFEQHTGISIGWINYNAHGLAEQDSRPVRERFTQRTMAYPEWMATGKSIIQTDKVNSMGTHYPSLPCRNLDMVLSDHTKVKDPYMSDFPEDKIVLDHYYTKSYEEWIKKLGRGSCDPFCIRKIDEFFIYNPDLIYLKQNEYKGE